MENRKQETEDRSQKTEDRSQKSEVSNAPGRGGYFLDAD